MAVKIHVTPEQVRAAQLEVQAMHSAGLTPESLVARLAKTKTAGVEAPKAWSISPDGPAEVSQAVYFHASRDSVREQSDAMDELEYLAMRRRDSAREQSEAMGELEYLAKRRRDQQEEYLRARAHADLRRRRLQYYIISIGSLVYAAISATFLSLTQKSWVTLAAVAVFVFIRTAIAFAVRGLRLSDTKAADRYWAGIAAVGEPVSTSGESRAETGADSSGSQHLKTD